MRARLAAVIASLAAACAPAAEPCPSAAGVLCTLSGTGELDHSGDHGPALEAAMALPLDAVAASSGDLYILDWGNSRIRKITPGGTIEHVAGSGELGTLNAPADLNHPTALLFGPDERTLWIAAWHNSQIRTLDLETLQLAHAYGDGRRTYFGDGGPASEASFDLPASLAFDPEGGLVVLDQANQVIRRVGEDGIIERIAGQCVVEPLDGDCESAELVPCPGGSGKLTCDPSLCTWPCSPGYTPDGGDALALRMFQPFGGAAEPGGRIAYDDDGNLYFADPGNHLIRRIDAGGRVTTIAGTPPVGGEPQSGYAGDGGPATAAKLNGPVDLAFGDGGTLYFTDVENHCVRAIDPAGIISTVVGVCGERGYAGDGGPATEALLELPYGIEYAGGTLYIADTGNNVIRAVALR